MSSFPTPTQIGLQYFQILKSIKPSLNTNDPNSDFVIRGNTLKGVVSGLYGDQQNVDNDTFISSMRLSALLLKGQDYAILQQPATPAVGSVSIPGTNGAVVNPGDLTFLYVPTNVLYSNTTGGTVASGTITVSIQCEITGQVGNIKSPDTLQVVSPPTGITNIATLIGDVADGADLESTDSYRARLLAREQNPPAGGNEADYSAFAFAADPTVRSVIIRRFGRGLGTVDVYITTGTTDINTAVTQGLAISRIPSGGTIATVQDYYNTHVPLTDCPGVFAPTELPIDVTMNVVLAAGLSMSSVPNDPVNNPLNLTCLQLIQREMGRVLYNYGSGGRVLPGSTTGYVVAADIEEGLDTWLAAYPNASTGATGGFIPILADRQIQKLNGSSYDLPLVENDLPAPGTMTVIEGGI